MLQVVTFTATFFQYSHEVHVSLLLAFLVMNVKMQLGLDSWRFILEATIEDDVFTRLSMEVNSLLLIPRA